MIDLVPNGTELTCKTCRHWNQVPIDPRDVGAVRPGECRCMPPQLVVLGADGRGNVAMQAMYPQVGPDAPACGQHCPVTAVPVLSKEV